jgi:hypothetical protein
MKIRKLRPYYFQTCEEVVIADCGFCPPRRIDTSHVCFSKHGKLSIASGYAWDGASGPAIDTDTFMRGSLVHDALYQLMRLGLLPIEFRDTADLLLKKICLEDGMNRFRAWYVYHAVSMFAARAALPRKDEVPVNIHAAD